MLIIIASNNFFGWRTACACSAFDLASETQQGRRHVPPVLLKKPAGGWLVETKFRIKRAREEEILLR
jgi:hypothetical protein